MAPWVTPLPCSLVPPVIATQPGAPGQGPKPVCDVRRVRTDVAVDRRHAGVRDAGAGEDGVPCRRCPSSRRSPPPGRSSPSLLRGRRRGLRPPPPRPGGVASGPSAWSGSASRFISLVAPATGVSHHVTTLSVDPHTQSVKLRAVDRGHRLPVMARASCQLQARSHVTAKEWPPAPRSGGSRLPHAAGGDHVDVVRLPGEERRDRDVRAVVGGGRAVREDELREPGESAGGGPDHRRLCDPLGRGLLVAAGSRHRPGELPASAAHERQGEPAVLDRDPTPSRCFPGRVGTASTRAGLPAPGTSPTRRNRRGRPPRSPSPSPVARPSPTRSRRSPPRTTQSCSRCRHTSPWAAPSCPRRR